MKKISVTGILILLFALNTAAQNLDSLYNTFLASRGIGGNVKNQNVTQSIKHDIKCGFGIVAAIRANFNSFSAEQQSILSTFIARYDNLHTSSVSPSGLFRIHYDSTGINAPNYFNIAGKTAAQIVRMSVDSLAAAFDKSYDYEVNYLGYAPPPPDNGHGGDNLYDIYIINFGNYGETTQDLNGRASYITIDNNFAGSGFYTHGIDAAKVTAAHEFHHSLQFAVDGYIPNETVFNEMTSSSMEEFVFDDVNDYYSYLPDYFNRTYDSFKNFSGYQLSLFILYLQQKFAKQGDPMKGHQIIKRAWELFKSEASAVDALSFALMENGLSLKSAWNEFGIWCYFTGGRTKPGEYFEEAENYPLVHPFASYKYTPPHKEYSITTEPITNNYLVFEITGDAIKDSLVSIITNGDIENGKFFPYENTNLTYTLSTENEAGSTNIVNQYYSKLECKPPELSALFAESNIFRNFEVRGATFESKTLDYAFPQPFVYSNNTAVYIPVEPNILEIADLNIYTPAMDLVYNSSNSRIILWGGEKIVVRWDALDNSGNKVPTGVYIYVTKSGNKLKKGKLVVYNE